MSIYDELDKLGKSSDMIEDIAGRVSEVDDEIRELTRNIYTLKDDFKEHSLDDAIELIEKQLEDFVSRLEDISKKLYWQV